VRSLLPGMADYRRNFLSWDAAHLVRGPMQPHFDAITEVWFEDAAAIEAFRQAFSDPVIQKRIEEDEAHFLDGKSVQILVVEESGGPA
jgi:hypothetical protein